MMCKSCCLQMIWCYGVPYLAKLVQRTTIHSGNLYGRTPIEKINGETPDISEYIDFGCYNWVIYKNKDVLGEVCLSIFLYILHGVWSPMFF